MSLARYSGWAAALGLVAVVAVTVEMIRTAPDDLNALPEPMPSAEAGVDTATWTLPVADSLLGRSHELRFRTLDRAGALALPGFVDALGEDAIRTPEVHRTALADGERFAYIVMRPFGEKKGAYLNGYRLGYWPAERWLMAKNYLNPPGFVEVWPTNVGVAVSAHFRLGDFVTHDQRDVWPKYVVLREALIDKLELVLADLAAHGIPARHAVILSGFRAPQYNDRTEHAAQASRHQYGDAADLIIDDDGNGRMDDLNHDGRVDLADTQVILRAVERVERKYPDLVGGLGLYQAMGPSGPFAHIDVRGTQARWGSDWWRRKSGD
jgi:hypothetical protein